MGGQCVPQDDVVDALDFFFSYDCFYFWVFFCLEPVESDCLECVFDGVFFAFVADLAVSDEEFGDAGVEAFCDEKGAVSAVGEDDFRVLFDVFEACCSEVCDCFLLVVSGFRDDCDFHREWRFYFCF